MITGDYHHTAVAVAKDVGMVKAEGQVVVIDTTHKELPQEVSAVQTPGNGNSMLATPQVSFQKRDADYAHGFFARAAGADAELRQLPEAGHRLDVSEVQPVNKVSLPVAQLSRRSVKGTQPKRISFKGAQPTRMSFDGVQSSRIPSEGPQLGRTSVDGSRPSRLSLEGCRMSFDGVQPSRISFEEPQVGRRSAEGSRPSRASLEGFHKKQLPFKATSIMKLPIEVALPDRVPLDAVLPEVSPTIRLSIVDSIPPQDATRAAAFKVKLPPIEAAHSEVQASFEAALQQSPSNGRLVRAASLTRLPSQTAVAMAALAPQSQDDSVCATPSNALMGVGHRLFQGSVARMIHPFRNTWDPTPAESHCDSQGSAMNGLTFTTGIGSHHVMDACDALTSMSEGSMQCAVTGEAFEYLLQMQDVSLLEAVLRNAVVFSRMQPHQKGQVMDLLGSRGIHQPYQGQPRHIQVCMPPPALRDCSLFGAGKVVQHDVKVYSGTSQHVHNCQNAVHVHMHDTLFVTICRTSLSVSALCSF